ncbi:MAG TPA: hypothetical protein ENJ60_01040 [Aeromonadales bacterium]|nr:hypothetical protein [Aeromonadales bacterium]
MNLLLSLAILATLTGPFIYVVFRKQQSLKQGIDAFILVITAGIIIFQVLPETFHSLGFFSIVLVVLGMGLPGLIEYLFRRAAAQTHVLTLILGVLGLLVHGVVDGSALTMSKYESGSLLPLAIVFHRTPISMTLWWLVKPQFGKMYAVSVIAILIIGTLLGFYFSSSVMMQLHNTQFMIFEALVSGTLLHVLYHQPGHEHHHHNNAETNAEHKQRWNKNSLMGAIIAVVLLIILTNITRIH